MQGPDVIFDKDAYYESVAKLTRWLALLLVGITIPFQRVQVIWIFLLIVLEASYNALRYSQKMMEQAWFRSKWNMLVVDNLLVTLFLALTGGVASPYLLFYVFMIIAAASWFGLAGYLPVVGYQSLSLLLMLGIQLNAGQDVGPEPLRQVVIKALTLLVIGFVAERLTSVERQERLLTAKASAEIEVERQRLLALINSLADPVLAVDNRGRVSLYNGAFLELLNSNAQLGGQTLSQLIKVTDDKERPVDLMQLANTTAGIMKRDDLIMVTEEGVRLMLDLSISRVQMSYANRRLGTGYIFILRDITKEKSLEEQKDEFISVASHELRTPLAIAEANISTALLPSFAQIDAKPLKLLRQAHQNIIFLGDLVRDLTTLSRAEREGQIADLKPVDPAAMLRQLASDYQVKAKAKGLSIKIEAAEGLAPVQTSEYRVHEIMQNFITNAIKYTPRGSVTLAAKPADSGVLFSVTDTGIGIGASDRKRLFTRFYRSEDYRTRQTQGTGLGLYITKKLAERIGARISYTSKLNQGSTFYLEVRSLQPAAARQAAVSPPKSNSGVAAAP